jgi:hypothetical protein
MPDLMAAEADVRIRDEVLDEVASIPAWAWEWRISLMQVPQLVNSRPLSGSALEIVRRERSIP